MKEAKTVLLTCHCYFFLYSSHLELLHLAPGRASICANVPRPFMGHTVCFADVWRLGELGSKSFQNKRHDNEGNQICQCLPIFVMFHSWLQSRLFVTGYYELFIPGSDS